MSLPNITERRVACAAIRYEDGLIVCGPRHLHPIMHAVIKAMGRSRLDGYDGRMEQGFVDFQGVWMDRAEALAVATSAGQIVRDCGGSTIHLFSENLG